MNTDEPCDCRVHDLTMGSVTEKSKYGDMLTCIWGKRAVNIGLGVHGALLRLRTALLCQALQQH